MCNKLSKAEHSTHFNPFSNIELYLETTQNIVYVVDLLVEDP